MLCFRLPHLNCQPYENTAELHLSEFIGTARHPDVQNIRITGFSFGNKLQWQSEEGKASTKACFRLHIYLRTNKALIHNSLQVFENWGKNLSHKKM